MSCFTTRAGGALAQQAFAGDISGCFQAGRRAAGRACGCGRGRAQQTVRRGRGRRRGRTVKRVRSRPGPRRARRRATQRAGRREMHTGGQSARGGGAGKIAKRPEHARPTSTLHPSCFVPRQRRRKGPTAMCEPGRRAAVGGAAPAVPRRGQSSPPSQRCLNASLPAAPTPAANKGLPALPPPVKQTPWPFPR